MPSYRTVSAPETTAPQTAPWRFWLIVTAGSGNLNGDSHPVISVRPIPLPLLPVNFPRLCAAVRVMREIHWIRFPLLAI
jgi:hypothetical protein